MMTEQANFTTITLTPDELDLLAECITARATFYDGLIDNGPDDFVRSYFDARRDDCDHLLEILEQAE